MAATHWLNISLTLDSITWHFGNFGEPGLVAQTEAGLRELVCTNSLNALLKRRIDDTSPGSAFRGRGPYEILEGAGLKTRRRNRSAS